MLTRRGRLTLSVLFILSILACHAGLSAGLAATTIYTYTDDSGTKTYTTEFHSIPERYRSQVVTLDFGASTSPPAQPPAAQPSAQADIRVVHASGEFRMGNHDTRADGVQLAVEAAKRQALEQVATYLESVTEVRNMDVTRDDIQSYTAGVVTILDEKISTTLDGDSIVIHADLTAQVDAAEVARAIAALRENDNAKTELIALQAESDALHRQLDAANRALTTAVSREEIDALNQQRQETLNQLQANALVAQAWTDWVYVTPGVSLYPWTGVRSVQSLLLRARQFYPRSHHLHRMQQVLTAHPASPPPTAVPGQPHASLLVPRQIVSPPMSSFRRILPGSNVGPPQTRSLSSLAPRQRFSSARPQLPSQQPFVTTPQVRSHGSTPNSLSHLAPFGNPARMGRPGGHPSGHSFSGGHASRGGHAGGGRHTR